MASHTKKQREGNKKSPKWQLKLKFQADLVGGSLPIHTHDSFELVRLEKKQNRKKKEQQ
jgi:hypothetical protein